MWRGQRDSNPPLCRGRCGAVRFFNNLQDRRDCQTPRKSFELAQDTRAMGWIGLNSKLTKTPIKRPFSAFSQVAQCRQTSEIRLISASNANSQMAGATSSLPDLFAFREVWLYHIT